MCDYFFQMDNSENVIEKLLSKNLHSVLRTVFLFLDLESLLNSKLVSKKWFQFITDFIWETKFGRLRLKQKMEKRDVF